MNIQSRRISPASAPSDDVRHLLELRDHLRKSLEIVEAQLGGTTDARAPNGDDGDLLYGVPAIAKFLGLTPAKVYHLASKGDAGSGDMPTFKIGGKVCARRSTLTAWLARLEG